MKVGDRVRNRLLGYTGTVVGIDDCVYIRRDDGRRGTGVDGAWGACARWLDPVTPAVYVAGSQHERERARAAMDILRRLGCAITHDWTLEGFDHEPTQFELSTYADLDIDGVRRADVLLVLTPERLDWGCGMWAELGIATALQKRIIVVGPQRDRCIFALKATRVETDLEGVLRCCE